MSGPKMPGIGMVASCSNCEKAFNVRDLRQCSGQRIPRLFPCGHAVCEVCVRASLMDKTRTSIVCGACKEVFPCCGTTKEIDVDFPMHFYIIGQFVTRRAQSEPEFVFRPAQAPVTISKKVLCDECEVNAATCICTRCESLPYCEACFVKIHSASKALRSHIPDDLSSAKCQTKMCSTHPLNRLDVYCDDCNSFICDKCSHLGHQGHTFAGLVKKNEELVPALMLAVDRAKFVKQRLQQSLKEVRAQSTGGVPVKGMAALAEAERLLVQQTAVLHGQLQLQESRAAGRIAEKRSEAQACLRDIEAALLASLSELKEALQVARFAAAPENLHSADLEAAKGRLERALDVPCHLVPGDVRAEVRVHFADQSDDLVSVDVSQDAHARLLTEEDLPESYNVSPLDVVDDFDSLEQSISSQSIKSASSTDSILETTSSSAGYVPYLLLPAGCSSKASLQFSDPLDNLQIGSTAFVTVTHMKNPSDFYVVLTSTVKKLSKLSKSISSQASKSQPASSINYAKFYAVKALDGLWYRGRIIQSEKDAEAKDCYQVFFIDHGSVETVNCAFIRPLSSMYQKAPPQAVNCSLNQLRPPTGVWTPEATAHMIQLIRGELNIHVINTLSGKRLVDLTVSGSSLRDTMVLLGIGAFQEAKDASVFSNRKKYPPMDDLPLGVLKNIVIISSLTTPWDFYVQTDPILMEKITTMIQQHVSLEIKESSILHPLIGMPCLAVYNQDGLWYRARILEVLTSESVRVKYIDFGNEDAVDCKNIRNVPNDLMQFPEQAISCALSDVAPVDEEWCEEVGDFLHLYLNKLYRMEVVSRKGDVYKVILYLECESSVFCLNGLLVEEGLAKSTSPRTLIPVFHRDDEDLNAVKKEVKKCAIEKPNLRVNSSSSEENTSQEMQTIGSHESANEAHKPAKAEVQTASLATDEEDLVNEMSPLKEKEILSSSEVSFIKKSSNTIPSICSHPEEEKIVGCEMVTIDKTSDPVLANGFNSEKLKGSPNMADTKCSNGIQEENSVQNVSNPIQKLQPPLDRSSSSELTTNGSKKGAKANTSVQSRLKQAQSTVPTPQSPSLMRVPVEVLAPESPSCIFLRLTIDKEKIERLMGDMLAFYKGDGLLKESINWRPNVLGRCAVRSSVDKHWYRAIVLDILSDSEFKVSLKDFGRTEIVPPTAIRKLAPIFSQIRDGSFKCHLANVKAAGGNLSNWSTMACEKLKEILKLHSSNLYISKKGQISEDRSLPVLLWIKMYISSALEPTIMKWITVNKYLVDEGLALPEDWDGMRKEEEGDDTISPNDYNILNPVNDPDLTYKEFLELDSDDSLDCGDMPMLKDDWLPSQPFVDRQFVGLPTYVDMDCHVYIHDVSRDTQTMDEVSKRLNKLFMFSKPTAEDYYWFENQMCSVRYHLDNSWYRGKVTKVNPNNQLEVQLVDYGNEESCSSSEVRKRVVCRETPILARKCKIVGLLPIGEDGRWDISTLDIIHNILVDHECIVTVIREPIPDDNTHLVEIITKDKKDVKEILAGENLARIIPTSYYAEPDVIVELEESEPDVVELEESEPNGVELEESEPDVVELEESEPNGVELKEREVLKCESISGAASETYTAIGPCNKKFSTVRSLLSSKFKPLTKFDTGPCSDQSLDSFHSDFTSDGYEAETSLGSFSPQDKSID